jgi:transcriptional regulator with XRE-family HTH domain
MAITRITGNQLRAGRALAGLTIEDLAARAQLHRQSARKWEGSSNAAVDAMVAHLSRALDVLEAEGIRFSDGGVYSHSSSGSENLIFRFSIKNPQRLPLNRALMAFARLTYRHRR